MEDFLQAIGEVVSLVFFAVAIALYLTYQSELSSFVYVGMVGALSFGIFFGFGKSVVRYRRSVKKAEAEDTETQLLVDVSPAALLYYDLTSWICVAAVLAIAMFSEQGISLINITQAIVVYIGFAVGRKFFIRVAS